MVNSNINFMMISKALAVSIEELKRDKQPSIFAMQKLKKAQDDLQQAQSFFLASRY